MLKKLCLIVLACTFSVLHAQEKTTLLLIRHGETDANAKRIYLGQTDAPLNEKGQEQAKQLAHYLAENHSDIATIYSSNLERAYATAQHTADLFNLTITQSHNLQEMHFGAAEGLDVETANELYHQHLNPHLKEQWDFPLFPGGESYNQLLLRAQDELVSIATAHPGKKVAVFTHGRLIKTIINESIDNGSNSRFPNCAIACLTFTHDNPTSPFVFLKIEDPLP